MAVTKPQTHTVQRSDFTSPTEVRKFDKGVLELVTLGGITFGRITAQPGWKWSAHVKPIVNTASCMSAHTMYVISGHLHVVMDNGTELDYHAGDVGVVPPGHDAWVVGNEPFVAIDVTGAENYATRNIAA